MTKLTIELPNSLQRRAAALAALDGLPIEHFIALAVAEKLSAMDALAFLREQATQGKREDFDRFLDAVPDREPIETDRMPE